MILRRQKTAPTPCAIFGAGLLVQALSEQHATTFAEGFKGFGTATVTVSPTFLTYGVDDQPPLTALFVLGLQHAGLAIMFIIYPVVAAQELGLSSFQTRSLITASLVAMGIATILQSLRPPLGSGTVAVQIPAVIILPSMIHAGSLGGLGALAGMNLVLGMTEAALARLLPRLRQLFPPEVCGVAVLMAGVSIAEPALTRFAGVHLSDLEQVAINPAYLMVATATLAVIVALAIFGRGPLKLFALVFGLLVGAAFSLLMGLFEPEGIANLRQAPLVGLPVLALPDWRFEILLVPLFMLIAVVNTVDNVGVLVSIQRLNDAEWKRADLRSAGGGLFANSVGNLVAGTLGGSAQALSSSHVGLAFASGATARVIALAAGILMLMALFLPKLVVALANIPAPVIGAIMVYASAYMIVSGMGLIVSRMLSERRIFTVGFSILLGFSVILIPDIYAGMPAWLEPLFSSELAIAALSAILLNLLFRIGITQRASTSVPDDRDPYDVSREFLKRQGHLWGARREVVLRAVQGASEALEVLRSHDLLKDEPELTARYDEFNLYVILTWRGEALETPKERPELDDILANEKGLRGLAGFLIRRYADRVSHRSDGEQQRLTLHFEH